MGGPRIRRPRLPHLEFNAQARVAGRVTRTWRVVGGLSWLGTVEWYSHWRRYVFRPEVHYWLKLVFDASCLREIADFCEEATVKHRVARKRLKENRV